MLASRLLCRDTKESTGLLSGGSGSSPGSVVPISMTLALSLVPCSPLLTFPSSRWLHFSDVCRGDLGCTVMIRVCKAQIYCSHCAEGKFFSCPEFVGWSKAFLCFPLIIIWTAMMSLLCLLIPSRCCLQFPWSKGFFKCSFPPFIPPLGKRCKQVMAYPTIPVKATRLLFLCSCCPGSFWFGKSNGHQLL